MRHVPIHQRRVDLVDHHPYAVPRGQVGDRLELLPAVHRACGVVRTAEQVRHAAPLTGHRGERLLEVTEVDAVIGVEGDSTARRPTFATNR